MVDNNNREIREYNIEDNEDFNKNYWISRLLSWWSGFSLRTKLLAIATGNDFRAVEACAHSYASKDGKYKSLTHVEISTNKFRYWIELPISIGTVGGLTNLHPLVNWSLKLLGSPSAKDLMKIIAVSGLAQNFAAIKSLITTGIQKGHMKMHLSNILNLLDTDDNERKQLVKFFDDKVVSHSLVKNKLKEIRNG